MTSERSCIRKAEDSDGSFGDSQNKPSLMGDDGELEYAEPKALCGQAAKRSASTAMSFSASIGEWYECWHKAIIAWRVQYRRRRRAAEFHLYYPEHLWSMD
jgi:hypothetical protein